MKRTLLILGILLLIVGGIYATFFSGKRQINVLVFSKTEGFRHSSIEPGIEAIRSLGKTYKFTVDATEDAGIFKEKTLQKYNVLIFLNTTGDFLNEAQQIELNRFIQAGGGFVGIHAAADAEYNWPWYNQLVGAYFESHPNNPNVREASIQVIDPEFIATKHLPSEWKRSDEWYNYKSINPNIHVVLNLDETSYEGGTNGENHPIAWYHEFDGGRVFYTGLGHTDESFSEPLLLDHIWGGISYAAGEGKKVNYDNASVTPEENRFRKIVLGDNLNEPMELEVLPDGKILFVERGGGIHLYDPAMDSILEVARLPVAMGAAKRLEDGLLGLALDPDYATNHWIYLFYSPIGDIPKQHVSRFVFKDGRLDESSEKVVLEIPVQRDQCCHSAGSLEFGPNGNLFISVGDNTSPRATGYAPADERPGRGPWDAQKSSGNTNDLRGKILRIHPETDGTYPIPDGNLFSKDGSEGKPEIYTMGNRNPYRISIDSRTGYLYWGEVGPDAGEDSIGRGPMGYDEVNQAKGPGNFGWPYFVGDNQAYYEYDFATGTASKTAFDPEKPINNSPNNTGAEELPPAQKAFIWYPYGESKEFPLVGDGGRNAMAGPVFYYSDYPDSDKKFPEYYDGKFFAYDWMRGWIMAVTMDENGAFVKMEQFLPGTTFNNPIDIVMGPEGDMYMLEYGTNWFTQNKDARLVHLSYVAGNRQPLAQISVSKSIGAAPLTVKFSGAGSKDFDGDDISFAWKFNSQTVQSTEIDPEFTYEKPGSYVASLLVTDPDGESHTAEIEILVGNELPELTWEITGGNRSFYFDNQTLSYEVIVSDEEDGSSGNGIDPKMVNISMDYLERGQDLNFIAQGHNALMDASAASLGKTLMDQSDCKACHQLDQKTVGPTYLDISNKYKDNSAAGTLLAEKIIKGGGGVWGDVVMAAHPQISLSEAKQMVKYILGLSGSGNSSQLLPMKGTYALDQHTGKGNEGTYIFTASYTDKGGNEIGPLTARDVITLQSPLVMASTLDETDKAMTFEVTPDMAPGIEKAFKVVIGNKGSYIRYNHFDLTGIHSMEVLASAFSGFMSGGLVEIRINGTEGEMIGSFNVETSLTPSLEPDPIQVDLKPTTGFHDLYFVFKGGKEGSKPVCAMVSFEFRMEKEG